MSIQNAAALSMLATHCAVCRRDLRDPVSVELGIGPDCRKKYGVMRSFFAGLLGVGPRGPFVVAGK